MPTFRIFVKQKSITSLCRNRDLLVYQRNNPILRLIADEKEGIQDTSHDSRKITSLKKLQVVQYSQEWDVLRIRGIGHLGISVYIC